MPLPQQVNDMQTPLEVHFHNVDQSPALEARIRKLAARLERFSAHIIHCRVTLEVQHRHHHQGNLFDTIVRIAVPGEEIVARSAHAADLAHEDPYVTLRDAFSAARRQLLEYERRRRGEVKTHVGPEEQVSGIDRGAGPDAASLH
jgi:ribosome-associated translation inhibitor RaiA